MLAVLLGLVFIVAGGYGVFIWRAEFIVFLKGALPLMFFVGGFISVIAGITSISESADPKAADENTDVQEKK